jgi:two-component system, OmpR family, KDP operon response regulator KdpE
MSNVTEAGPSRSTRILVVDDQPEVRRAISALLHTKGFDVVTAETGADGLREFDNSEFDVAIIDTFLQGPLNGPDVIKSLREGKPTLPIVAMSGRAARDLNRQVAELSGVVSLRKPFRAHELFEAVRKATELA